MVFKRFRVVCAVRVGALALTLGAAAWLLFGSSNRNLGFVLALTAAYQAVALVRYVEKTNRDLARFFESIRYEDFSQNFKDDGQGAAFRELRTILTAVMDTLRRTRADKEEHAQYLQTIVQHVGVGLLAFRPDGEVELINAAAKLLFRVSSLKTVEALRSRSPELVDTLLRLRPQENAFVKLSDGKEPLTLALRAAEFKLGGRQYKLVSIHNIQRELEEKEMEAWQTLIRVITHEIMNSVTPISTLASAIGDLVTLDSSEAGEPGRSETRKDIEEAARAIEKRSRGLLHFVEAFRTLTLLPKPSMHVFAVRELFDRVGRLMQAHMAARNVRFTVGIEPETMELEGDAELLEQLLINLLLNALQALEGRESAAIGLRAFLNDRGRILIQVSDNGPGIPPENIEKIFVPFYSTKPGGSGIGLSLSRQIMRLHRGSIYARSETGGATVFTLSF
jgi:two-component system nitrogen regulation sensor histidine kinase NtrY